MAESPSPSLRFPRSRRLKQRREFTRVKMQGKRTIHGCLIVNWLPLPEGQATRLGVITSRKIGNAVVRSRSRRLLREAFRLHQHEFRQPLDLVLVARASIAGKTFQEVETDFLTALKRAKMWQDAG